MAMDRVVNTRMVEVGLPAATSVVGLALLAREVSRISRPVLDTDMSSSVNLVAVEYVTWVFARRRVANRCAEDGFEECQMVEEGETLLSSSGHVLRGSKRV
jgi:hypothetical protein